MPAGRPTTEHTSRRRPRPNLATALYYLEGCDLAVHVDRAYRQPTNMQPGTFCYR